MAWVYLDDHFVEHPRIVDAFELGGPAAPLLFVSGLCYARRNNTDGRIPGSAVRGLMGYTWKAKRALVCTELWEKVGPGDAIAIHDFRQWNFTAEERTERARKAANVRWARANSRGL